MDIQEYIKGLEIPYYHSISFNNGYLKLSYQDLYLCEDMVFNNHDKVFVINIKKFNLDETSIKKIIDKFIENAEERVKTRPYRIKRLEDIDNIGYTNIWDFQYSDCGKKDRYLCGEGRCDY